jgi:hypothetical protein
VRDVGDRTAERRDSITTLLCDELEKGLSIRVACDIVGIDESAYYHWRRQAEAGDDEAIQLMRRLKAARAKGFEQHVGKIKAIADQTDDWRARGWLVDKLYPGWTGDKATVEEIAYRVEQDQDGRPVESWAAPDRLREIALMAVETGVVPIEELTGVAPKQPRPTADQAEPPSDREPLADHIRQTVIVALAAGEREGKELTDCIVNTLRCTAEDVYKAYDQLNVQLLEQRGAPTMVRLETPPSFPRTNENVEPHQDVAQTPSEPPQAAETSGSGWLDGGGEGVGDMIARRRGR